MTSESSAKLARLYKSLKTGHGFVVRPGYTVVFGPLQGRLWQESQEKAYVVQVLEASRVFPDRILQLVEAAG